MEFTEEHKKIGAHLNPFIKKLTEAVSEYPNLFLTGFVYDGGGEEQPLLIRFGNISNTGMDLVRIHYSLSRMAAAIEAMGGFTLTEDVVESDGESGPEGPSPEELADRMALMLCAVPSKTLPQPVVDLLDQYVKSRRPETT